VPTRDRPNYIKSDIYNSTIFVDLSKFEFADETSFFSVTLLQFPVSRIGQ